MKLALIGASGMIGSEILNEALSRGHEVTGIVRHPEKLPEHPHLHAVKGDVFDGDNLQKQLQGHDAVISAVHYTASDLPTLLNAIKLSGVKRYLVVGGAGSLELASGKQLVDTPIFPAEYKVEARKGRDYLEMLKQEDELDWTFLSPSIEIAPGKRTGRFRLGRDQPLFDEVGKSSISTQDYAIAMVDELEKPTHQRKRFTVGY